MYIFLDTSTPVCKLWIYENEQQALHEWEAGRELAGGILAFLGETLGGFDHIDGIGVYQGPGSFTGLRIGMTVLNTIADTNKIPIVGEQGGDWRAKAAERLMDSQNDTIVLPVYGRSANITKPRK